MSTGLILTMGFSPEPLVFSIRETKAAFVVFIGTDSSLKNSVDQTVIESGLRPSQYHKLEVIDSPDEIGSICERFQEAINWLEKQEVTDIICDISGGKKWMSAGTVMAASFLGIPMIYIDARYDKSKVIPDTMKIVELGNAYDQTGFIIAAKGKDAYNTYNFGGAAEHFERISPTHAHKKEMFQGLSHLCSQLARWDCFEHYGSSVSKGIEEAIQQIDRALRSGAGTSLFASFSDNLKIFAEHIKGIEATQKLSIEFIVDIYLNAGRCIKRNRFDDAIARHYRTLEAIAQYFLQEKGVDTDNPDYSGLTAKQNDLFRSALRGNSKEDKGLPEKIDLKLGFWLLRVLEHPVKDQVFKGKQAFKEFTFEGVLNDRNNSILAHGFKPIGKERVEKFHTTLQELLEQAFGDKFQQVKQRLQLPHMPEIGF